jgi:hypothetical protein
MYQPVVPQPKRKVRVFTWVILAINALFLIWVIAGVASGSGHATDCGSLDQNTCDSASHVGTAIGVGIIVFLWAAADLILGVIWLVTRKRTPAVVYVQAPYPYLPPAAPHGYAQQPAWVNPGSAPLPGSAPESR